MYFYFSIQVFGASHKVIAHSGFTTTKINESAQHLARIRGVRVMKHCSAELANSGGGLAAARLLA